MKEFMIIAASIGVVITLVAWGLSTYTYRKYGSKPFTLENWGIALGAGALFVIGSLGVYFSSDPGRFSIILAIVGWTSSTCLIVWLFIRILKMGNWWIAICMTILLLLSGLICAIPAMVIALIIGFVGNYLKDRKTSTKTKSSYQESDDIDFGNLTSTKRTLQDNQTNRASEWDTDRKREKAKREKEQQDVHKKNKDSFERAKEEQARQNEAREARKLADDDRKAREAERKRENAYVACMNCGKTAGASAGWWWVCDTCGYRVCSNCFSQHTGSIWKGKKGGPKCTQCIQGFLKN